MRRFLMEGKDAIFGVPVGTLIYGGGKRVLRSFSDFDLSAEPYMKQEENRIFYFGDMDYEGIGIYENLAEEFPRIEPFVPGYEAMLDRADRLDKYKTEAKEWPVDTGQRGISGRPVRRLPETKEQQNKNLTGRFFSCFREETVRQMEQILEEGRYIPQEILNIQDFQGGRRNSNAV